MLSYNVILLGRRALLYIIARKLMLTQVNKNNNRDDGCWRRGGFLLLADELAGAHPWQQPRMDWP